MISIPSELYLQKIEDLYSQLPANRLEEPLIIQLPAEVKEVTISALPSVLQFLVTASRDYKVALQSRYSESDDKEKILKAAKSYLWYIMSSLHWLDDFTLQTGQSLKKDIRPVNAEINELMRNYLPVGSSYMMTCFDHLPPNKGLLKMFYNPPNYELVDEYAIENYISLIISHLGEKLSKSVFKQLHELLKPLTAIIYELFKNTDDWATKDRFGNKIEPGVRAIYFKYFKNFRDKFTEYCDNNKNLTRYFQHELHKEDNEGKLSFLEISVMDSGDGFVAKRMGKNYDESMTIEEEVKIVKDCLTKYFTNATGKQAILKGFGLDRVLKTIDKKGFIRIRTNRVSVCRDMVASSYQPDSEAENILLNDWTTQSSTEFQACSRAKGTVITIVLPLENPQ